MFVPSVQSLMSALNQDKAALDEAGHVRVPTGLLKLLLQIAVAAADFDEERYLQENPDVAKAVSRGRSKVRTYTMSDSATSRAAAEEARP